jgi:hypothetical protein
LIDQARENCGNCEVRRGGYLVRNTANKKLRFHVTRPGESEPCFYLETVQEVFRMIDLDKALSAGESVTVGQWEPLGSDA